MNSGRRLRRGSGRTTLHQVATLAEVSPITVSRFFNAPEKVSTELHARIAKAAATLNYVPNRVAGGLASARGHVVGMIIPNIAGPIFASTIQNFSDQLENFGYQLLLASSNFNGEREERIVRDFLGWSPAALVVTSCNDHTRNTQQLLAKANIPIVETWNYRPRSAHIQVGFPHAEVGSIAAEHFYARGYRRIAYMQTPVSGDAMAVVRYEAFKRTLREKYALEVYLHEPRSPNPIEAGKESIEHLIKQKKIEAVFCAHDNLALGALTAAQRLGITVPEHCAILGFGDFSFSSALVPRLSTIKPPAAKIGEIAALRILELLDRIPLEKAPSRLNRLSCELIARETT